MSLELLREGLQDLEHEFYGGVGEDQIRAASVELGLALPPSYVKFLRTLGCGWISHQEIFGLGGPQHLDIVGMTIALKSSVSRHPMPRQFVPILADGFGNYECLDTSRGDANGECPIVQWNHEGSKLERPPDIADSFFPWLEGLLRQIRSIEASDRESSE